MYNWIIGLAKRVARGMQGRQRSHGGRRLRRESGYGSVDWRAWDIQGASSEAIAPFSCALAVVFMGEPGSPDGKISD